MKLEKIYITNYTNMHVGSGGVSGKITINEYQRDYMSKEPIIPASSLKGSMRQHLSMVEDFEPTLNYIFGSSEDQGEIMQGDISFLDAKLIAYPVRLSINMDTPFVYMVKEANIEAARKQRFVRAIKPFGNINSGAYIENYKIASEDNIYQLDSLNVVVVPDQVFEKIVEKAPIITRNKVENGTSKNVWHEEFVPRFSVFEASFIYSDVQLSEAIHIKRFLQELQKFNTEKLEDMIQIGGNASIGMGYCRLILEEN